MISHPIIRTRRRISRSAVAAALVLSLGVQAIPAGAAVNSTIQTVSGSTTCNSSDRTMTLGATISLNDANGGWVAYRFQYFQVNAAGARTSAVYGGNWLGPYYVDTWTETAGAAWFGPTAPTTQMNNPVLLPGGTVTWAGRLHAQVEVAVWIPGYGYDYTGLMDINEYTSYYPTSLGTQSTTGSGCMTAW